MRQNGLLFKGVTEQAIVAAYERSSVLLAPCLDNLSITGYNLDIWQIATMSLTYKKNVADSRKTPVKEMIKELGQFGVGIVGCVPLHSSSQYF